MSAKVGISEVLNLIPEFSGEKGEIEFVYFREGCRVALKVLQNSNKDDLLLMFIKNKLKGNAYTRFALSSTSYQSVAEFLKDVKKIYASKCDERSYWELMIRSTFQKPDESLQEYSAKLQEYLQCAKLGIMYGEVKQNPISNISKEEKMKIMEAYASSHFVEKMLPGKVQRDLKIYSQGISSITLMDIVTAAAKWTVMDESEPCSLSSDSDEYSGYELWSEHARKETGNIFFRKETGMPDEEANALERSLNESQSNSNNNSKPQNHKNDLSRNKRQSSKNQNKK